MKQTILRRELPLHLMILPAVLALLIFHYLPMAGIVIAFEKFVPAKGIFGSKWVGFANFTSLMNLPGTFQVVFNTFYIAFMKIVAHITFPVFFALMLNELGRKRFKRVVQTVVYLPHFLSWIILSGILLDILSPSSGFVNQFIKFLGLKPVFFLGNENWFPYVMLITDVWKEFGFGTIVILAALTGIDPTHYEAAVIDGAGRWKQTVHITIPGILPVVILITILSLGDILNAGFDQIYNLYSPSVYKTGDIIDTMVYRLGILDMQYGLSTAAGLFKSVVSLVFVLASYFMADKFAGYRVF